GFYLWGCPVRKRYERVAPCDPYSRFFEHLANGAHVVRKRVFERESGQGGDRRHRVAISRIGRVEPISLVQTTSRKHMGAAHERDFMVTSNKADVKTLWCWF